MDNLNKDIGRKIIELRKSRGYTREDLAKKIGMSPNTLRNYENGLREPGHQFIKDVASHFNVTSDYLLGLDKKNPLQKQGMTAEEKAKFTDDLTALLIRYGFVGENGDISDADLEMLKGIALLLHAYRQRRSQVVK